MQSSRPQKVLVIGAGLAGLTAAFELREAGLEVTVVEARSRPGGRVLTLRQPFSDGLYVEAGAKYVLGDHDVVIRFARELGVQLAPLPSAADDREMFYVRGKKVVTRADDGEAWSRIYSLTAEECRAGLAGLEKKYVAGMLAALGDPRASAWWRQLHSELDTLTFRELLQRQGASEDVAELFGMGTFGIIGDGLGEVSALALLRRHALLVSGACRGVFTIQGGSERLPLALARELADVIRFDCEVEVIAQDETQVQVSCRTRDGDKRVFRADYVVIAIPFSVLRTLRVEPPFSAPKREIVGELPHTSVARVYLQCDLQLWGEHAHESVSTDLPVMQLRHATRGQQASAGVLESYVTGPPARIAAAMSEDERIDFVLAHAEQVFPSIRAHFQRGAAYCWDEDRWARGAFAWFRPGQLSRWREHLAAPEGRVYFAGDQTSILPGWMEGAMTSGAAAAREINARAAQPGRCEGATEWSDRFR